MNLGELREQLRNDILDDPEMPGEDDPSGADKDADSLWSNAELNRYLNRAVKEACIRSLLLRDTETASVCEIDVKADTASYDLHDSIIDVEIVTMPGRDYPLTRTSVDELDYSMPAWRTQELGTPHSYILDLNTQKIRFVPIPTSADTATLAVRRTPTDHEEMEYDMDCPVIAERYHEELLDYAAYRAYLKKDAEARDEDNASKHYQIFEKNFGRKPSAWEMDRKLHETVTGGPAFFF